MSSLVNEILSVILLYRLMIQSTCKSIICIQPGISYVIQCNNTSPTYCESLCSSSIIENTTIPLIPSCPNNQDCKIVCHGYQSCKESNIQCPININNQYTCTVDCIGDNSCLSTKIYAQQSNKLIINCNGYNSCKNINIWCPIYTDNNHSNCIIKGSDQSIHSNLMFYSQNSWNDINLTEYYGSIDINNNFNEMYCGNNYSYSCFISSLTWNCLDNKSECYINNMYTTIPIQITTFYPTNFNIDQVTTINDDDDSGRSNNNRDNSILIAGGGIIGLCIFCCSLILCGCACQRRKSEDKHKHKPKLTEKQKNKIKVYGADGMDDTIVVDTENIAFNETNITDSMDEDEDIDAIIDIEMNRKR